MKLFNSKVGRHNITAASVMRDPVLWLAFGFGSGLVRKAPGTFGTVAAIPVYLVLMQLNILLYLLVTVIVSVVGIWICGVAADKLGEHDFGGIVWDEIAGYLITMAFVGFSWQNLVIGFMLFRFFDIIKPWPIKWIDQRVSGGFGIMFDDVIAGVFAGLLLMYIN